MAETTDDWDRVQADLRTGAYGPWGDVRDAVCDHLARVAPDEGISSSDVNHTAYGWVKSGSLVLGGGEV